MRTLALIVGAWVASGAVVVFAFSRIARGLKAMRRARAAGRRTA